MNTETEVGLALIKLGLTALSRTGVIYAPDVQETLDEFARLAEQLKERELELG